MTAINSRCGVLVALVQDVPAEVVLLAAGQETHLRKHNGVEMVILFQFSKPNGARHLVRGLVKFQCAVA